MASDGRPGQRHHSSATSKGRRQADTFALLILPERLYQHNQGIAFILYKPIEPSTARLLAALTMADSYVTTLPHAEESFRVFVVSIV